MSAKKFLRVNSKPRGLDLFLLLSTLPRNCAIFLRKTGLTGFNWFQVTGFNLHPREVVNHLRRGLSGEMLCTHLLTFISLDFVGGHWVIVRPLTHRGAGRRSPQNFSPPLEKCVGHSFKKWVPLRKLSPRQVCQAGYGPGDSGLL